MRLATPDDKQAIEAICNNPLIRVWTAFDGAPLCNADNYQSPSFSIFDERGCFLLKHLDAGRYVVHTNLLPECRGHNAAKAMREALELTFITTDAIELLTMVPVTMPHVKLMARAMGFRHLFDRHALWPAGGRQDMGFYALSLDDWITQGHCLPQGKQFHERLHVELKQSEHPHDDVHNAYVGATVQMVLAGNVDKAIETYNRWARFALYESISIVSTEPLRIDIKQCVLRVEENQFFMEAPCLKQ